MSNLRVEGGEKNTASQALFFFNCQNKSFHAGVTENMISDSRLLQGVENFYEREQFGVVSLGFEGGKS